MEAYSWSSSSSISSKEEKEESKGRGRSIERVLNDDAIVVDNDKQKKKKKKKKTITTTTMTAIGAATSVAEQPQEETNQVKKTIKKKKKKKDSKTSRSRSKSKTKNKNRTKSEDKVRRSSSKDPIKKKTKNKKSRSKSEVNLEEYNLPLSSLPKPLKRAQSIITIQPEERTKSNEQMVRPLKRSSSTNKIKYVPKQSHSNTEDIIKTFKKSSLAGVEKAPKRSKSTGKTKKRSKSIDKLSKNENSKESTSTPLMDVKDRGNTNTHTAAKASSRPSLIRQPSGTRRGKKAEYSSENDHISAFKVNKEQKSSIPERRGQRGPKGMLLSRQNSQELGRILKREASEADIFAALNAESEDLQEEKEQQAQYELNRSFSKKLDVVRWKKEADDCSISSEESDFGEGTEFDLRQPLESQSEHIPRQKIPTRTKSLKSVSADRQGRPILQRQKSATKWRPGMKVKPMGAEELRQMLQLKGVQPKKEEWKDSRWFREDQQEMQQGHDELEAVVVNSKGRRSKVKKALFSYIANDSSNDLNFSIH